MLDNIAGDIWLVEGKIVDFYGFPYPTRCVVVRLPDGGLWVWSPIALSPDLRKQIETIGRPTHLVSPNRLHHLYLQDWKDAWPDARLWGPRTTIRKRPDLTFQTPLEDAPPPEWQGTFDQAWLRGALFLDEIVFFHRESGTVMLADMSENFTATFLHAHWSWWQRRIAQLWKIVEGYGYAPLEVRLSVRRRTPLRAARDRILDWNPERVIMAHGKWQRQDGRAYLEKAFEWI